MCYLSEHSYFKKETTENWGIIKFDVFIFHVPYHGETFLGKIYVSTEKGMTFCTFTDFNGEREVENFLDVPQEFKELYGYAIREKIKRS